MIAVEDGIIRSLESGVDPSGLTHARTFLDCAAVPGIPNLHSHAFQRQLAGLSEYRTGEHDSFWTWRQIMYQHAADWNPDDVYAIAHRLYQELRRSGYSWVGEFHYLHNDRDGSHYADLSSMADAVTQAAIDANLSICLLPVLYQRSGFEPGELDPVQKRFTLSTDDFLRLLEDVTQRWDDHPHVNIGVAFHSLRAVDIATIGSVTHCLHSRGRSLPIHIHVAEQMGEVQACQSQNGARPR